MKKLSMISTIAVIAVLMILNTSNIFSQQQQKRPPMIPDDQQISKMVDEMAQELSLTKTQKEEITLLHKQHFAEVKQLMDTEKSEREQMKQKHDQLRIDFENRMRSVMKEDQLQKYDEFMKKLEQRHQQKMQNRDGAPSGNKN